MPEDRVGFADFVLPLVQRGRLILWITGVVAVGSVVAALLWPQSWRAGATLLPPERRMDNPLFVPGGLESIGSSLRGITLRQVATPTDIFIAILQSRNVAEALAVRFDLTQEYDVKFVGKAAKELQERTDVGTTRDGTIQVAVIASSPQLAADLANGYLEELDRMNRTLANQEATAIRVFVESELGDAKGRLGSAEEELRDFQESHGAFSIADQASAVIAAAAEVAAQILGTEVELGVLLRSRDDSHPDVQRTRDYLDELRLRLAEIEGGAGPLLVQTDEAEPPGTNGDHGHSMATREIFPPLAAIPALGLKYGRLLRDMKTEEAIVALLTEQYHRARIEERRSLPTVRVLDDAVPPVRRFRPRRTILVLVSTGAALVLSVMLAFALEIVSRVRRDPGRYPGLHQIAGEFRKGIRS